MSKAKRVPGLKGNPKSMRIAKSKRNGYMAVERKTVQGPYDPSPRIRGGKAGKTRRYLPFGHVARTHDNYKWNGSARGVKPRALPCPVTRGRQPVHNRKDERLDGWTLAS